MKKKHLLIIAGLAIILTAGLFSSLSPNETAEYKPRANNEIVDVTGFRGAQAWLHSMRADINGEIDIDAMRKGVAEVEAKANAKSSNNSEILWKELGPDNVGGRSRSILFDMNNSNIVYTGGVSGGLWKSATGGLSWNKVLYSGDALSDGISNLNVTCIAQAANGDIYFGTGESWNGSSNVNMVGTNGQGIWKSTDGVNFSRLANTFTTNDQKDIFQAVQRIAADPNDANKLYAATYKGLRVTTDGGQNWESIPDGISLGSKYKFCQDVKTNGNLVVASLDDKTFISTDSGINFSTSILYPSVSAGRLEFAIAPSDNNYIYCQAANPNGTLENIYQSIDMGQTWDVIGPGGYLTFQPLGDQGTYDNAIAVYPNDPGKIMVGGQSTMHIWSANTEWTPIANGYFDPADFRYVHADHHDIVFHPDHATTNSTGNQTVLIATDGGIFISEDDGVSFNARNKNLNITQFYSVGYDGAGHVVGGTQDNGTQYNDFGGNTIRNFYEISGGDGGEAEMSMLDPRVTFATIYYGSVRRNQEKGSDMYETGTFFYNNKMLNMYFGGLEGNIGNPEYPSGPFVTKIKLWESFNDVNSIDSIIFVNDTVIVPFEEYNNYYANLEASYNNFNVDTSHYINANNELFINVALTISAGETVMGNSSINALPLEHELASTLYPGDTVQIQDTYQAMFAVPLFNFVTSEWNIHLTRKPLNFEVLAPFQPWAYILANSPGGGLWSFRDIEFSHDGEYLFYAINNSLYRISNLSNSRTFEQLDKGGVDYNLDVELINSFSGTINDIAVDPNNPDNVFISLSGYTSDNIWYSSNATSSSVNFTGKQGGGATKLPSIPVFTGIINTMDGLQIMVGTEFGVYSTDDITAINPEWTDQSMTTNGMSHVLTADIRQQKFENNWKHSVYNHGYIYVGTHGRGIFQSDSWKGPVGIQEPIENTITSSPSFNIYPNPINTYATLDINLPRGSDVIIKVYDLQGKIVMFKDAGNFTSGNHKLSYDFSELNAGTYIVNIITRDKKSSAKVIVN